MNHYLGIDFGATRLRAAIADNTGFIEDSIKTKTPNASDSDEITVKIQKLIRKVSDKSDVSLDEISAVGIGSIGPLDVETGEIVQPPNLPDSIGRIPIRKAVSEYVNTDEIYVLNDSTAGIMGEQYYLDGSDDDVSEDMVYLTMSTGISAGIVMNGNLLGKNAGEVGHWMMDKDSEMTCGCGHNGHWEAYSGGNNIPEYARHLYHERNLTTDLPIDSPSLEPREIFAKYDEGDTVANETIKEIQRWNVHGILNIIYAFNPTVLSIGGSVALENRKLMIEDVRDEVEANLIIDPPLIRPTPYGEDVVVRGAIARAISG